MQSVLEKITANEKLQKLIISTGNLMHLSEDCKCIHSDELRFGLELALQNSQTETNATDQGGSSQAEVKIFHNSKQLVEKLQDRKSVCVGAKIFLNDNNKDCLQQAIHTLLAILDTQYIENLVLSYRPSSKPTVTECAAANASCNESGIEQLKELWPALEELVLQEKIKLLGVADVDISTLLELHAVTKIKPSILQIKAAQCYDLPEVLHEFCAANDIEMRSHCDSQQLLADDEFLVPNCHINWILRYHAFMHDRCILVAKGYILAATRK